MTVKVYGFPLSVATNAVELILKELNVPYEIFNVDLTKREHESEEYLKNFHPFGQVPVLVDDDGFKLYESRAIARYIIAKYGPNSGLIPKDPKNNALFEQAASIEVTDFTSLAQGLIQEKLIKPKKGLQTSDFIVDEISKKLEENLKAYERILSKQKCLAGDELTLADLLHIPTGHIITEAVGFNGLKATPNVARWWADISSRSTWKQIADAAKSYAQSRGF